MDDVLRRRSVGAPAARSTLLTVLGEYLLGRPDGAWQEAHAWRRFPFIDPDLPDDLLPRDWPRRSAYELFSERHDRWAPAAQEHFDSLAT